MLKQQFSFPDDHGIIDENLHKMHPRTNKQKSIAEQIFKGKNYNSSFISYINIHKKL